MAKACVFDAAERLDEYFSEDLPFSSLKALTISRCLDFRAVTLKLEITPDLE